MPAGGLRRALAQGGEEARRVGVVRVHGPCVEDQRVGGAHDLRDLRRAIRYLERAQLVRDRDVRARIALRRQAADDVVEALRLDVDRLVAPVVEPQCAEGGVVHRRGAAVAHGMTEDGDLHQHFVGELPPAASRASL